MFLHVLTHLQVIGIPDVHFLNFMVYFIIYHSGDIRKNVSLLGIV